MSTEVDIASLVADANARAGRPGKFEHCSPAGVYFWNMAHAQDESGEGPHGFYIGFRIDADDAALFPGLRQWIGCRIRVTEDEQGFVKARIVIADHPDWNNEGFAPWMVVDPGGNPWTDEDDQPITMSQSEAVACVNAGGPCPDAIPGVWSCRPAPLED